MHQIVNYIDLYYGKNRKKKELSGRNSNISNNVENGGFSQNGKGGKGKVFQMAHFWRKLRKAKRIGNSSRMIRLISVHQTDNSYRFAL